MVLTHRIRSIILFVVLVAASTVLAQEHRSAWMWNDYSSPYGSLNIIGDPLAEINIVNDFQLWGFDRIYASLSSNATKVAGWNARLDDAGIESQILMGNASWIYPGTSRNSLLNAVRELVINFNASRTDSREWVDGIHLDIEPHALTEWSLGNLEDQQNLLLLLRDTYADVRNLLDSNGQSQVKIYADLPVWFDDMWAAEDRDQWFADISESLDGISMMAYKRRYMSSIISGVQYEIDHFDGEVRIGLEAASGPGQTWATFQDLLDMADDLEAYYGDAIGGIDFHPLTTWAEQAEHAPQIIGDVNYDGHVDIEDLNVVLAAWNQTVTPFSPADPSGDGIVNIADLSYVLAHWNVGETVVAGVTIPEPATGMILLLAGVGIFRRP